MKPNVCIILVCCFAAIVMAAACGRSDFDQQVQRAEALMQTAPDSALAIAQALKPDSRAERARAALLLTKARYKAYVPLTDDSLINIAADHYAGSGDSLEIQALFFQGETYYELGNYAKSLLATIKAEKTVEKGSDWVYAGRIHRLIAQLYACYYSYSNEYNHRIKSARYFRKALKPEFAKWEELDASLAMTAKGSYSEAQKILNEIALDTLGMPDDFRARFHKYQAYLNFLQNGYPDVIINMSAAQSIDNSMESHDFSTLARTYIRLGQLDKASSYIDSALSIAATLADNGNVFLAISELSDQKGDIESAYKYS